MCETRQRGCTLSRISTRNASLTRCLCYETKLCVSWNMLPTKTDKFADMASAKDFGWIACFYLTSIWLIVWVSRAERRNAKWSAPSTTALTPRVPALTGLRASGVSALGLLDAVLKERGICGANGELKAASERVLPCPVAYAAAIQHPSNNPALQDPILSALSASLGGRRKDRQTHWQSSRSGMNISWSNNHKSESNHNDRFHAKAAELVIALAISSEEGVTAVNHWLTKAVAAF